MQDTDTFISTCADLLPGDEISATFKGTLVHRGRVTETAPDHGLFWIMDDLTGGRRLLDMAELQIMRTQGVQTQGVQTGTPTAA